jgi:hypothetical protein
MAKSIDGLSKQAKGSPEEPEKVVAEKPAETPAEPVADPVAEKAAEPAVEEKPATPTPEPTAEAPAAPEKAAEPAAAEAPVAVVPPTSPSAKPEGFDLFPEPSVVVSGPPTWLWWLLLIAGAAGLGFLAFDLTRGRIDNWLASDSPTPTPTVSASPGTDASPTPTPDTSTSPTATPTATPTTGTIDKSKVTLRVLNGTTQAGAAATTKTTLEKAGFTVKSIGNAKSQTYTKTYVYYQAGKKAEADAVLAALADSKAVLEESTLANPDMVLVVFGK